MLSGIQEWPMYLKLRLSAIAATELLCSAVATKESESCCERGSVTQKCKQSQVENDSNQETLVAISPEFSDKYKKQR